MILFIWNHSQSEEINFKYISPVPNSELNSRNASIILKSTEDILLSSLDNGFFKVLGANKEYKCSVTLSDDNRTVIITPSEKFLPNEIVTVITGYDRKLKTQNGNTISSLSYSFGVTPLEEPIRVSFDYNDKLLLNEEIKNEVLSDTLPPDYPKVTIGKFDNPSKGFTFLSNNTTSGGTYIIVLNDSAKPYKYQKTPAPAFDFKVQPNGLLSYQLPVRRAIAGDGQAPSVMIITDTNLAIINSFQCKSGYTADFHDGIWAPNGHIFLISYDPQPMDMSKKVSGGNPNAIVIGAIVQELDAKKNLVFQWRSWDHIPLEESYIPLTDPVVDYMHINAVESDLDGNIMISSRHLCEITKINRQTGDIMWRLCGKMNDFKFINEHEGNAPLYFTHQHDIRRLINGNITLFDNGNAHVPQYSRAVEYKLDEVKKEATMVWEYRNTPDIITSNQSSMQRLDNGNTFIGWGGAGFTGGTSVSEVTPDKKILLELSLPKGATFGQTSYRAYKFPWQPGQAKCEVQKSTILKSRSYDFNELENVTGVKIGNVVDITSTAGNSLTVVKYDWAAMNVEFNIDAPWVPKHRVVLKGDNITSMKCEIRFDLNEFQWIKFPDKYSIFYRPTEGNGVFAKLATTYDAVKNELVAVSDGMGEYIFGLETQVGTLKAPVLITPEDKQKMNDQVKASLLWSAEGMFDNSELLIASDNAFTTILLDSSKLKTTNYMFPVESGKTYYWKVRIENSKGFSPWSEIKRFTATNPYITLLSPIGGEIWVRDSANYLIRWDENTVGNLTIELYQNDVYLQQVQDSVISKTGAVFWQISSSTPLGNNFKIRVANQKNPTIYSMSSANFTIREAGVEVEELANNSKELIVMFTNYPNPCSDFTNFSFKVNQAGNFAINIYNAEGLLIDKLTDMYYPEGLFVLPWSSLKYSSGNYRIVLTNGNNSFSKEFLIIK